MTLEKPGSRFFLGLDLGQARDYSAIAVAERRVELTGAHDPITYLQGTRTASSSAISSASPCGRPIPTSSSVCEP
jgi:hypothetical protein